MLDHGLAVRRKGTSECFKPDDEAFCSSFLFGLDLYAKIRK